MKPIILSMSKRARPGNPLVAVGYVRVSTDDQALGPTKCDRIARDLVVAVMVERGAVVAGAILRTAEGSSDLGGPEAAMMRGIVDVFAA
jgi:hypothetical protein